MGHVVGLLLLGQNRHLLLLLDQVITHLLLLLGHLTAHLLLLVCQLVRHRHHLRQARPRPPHRPLSSGPTRNDILISTNPTLLTPVSTSLFFTFGFGFFMLR